MGDDKNVAMTSRVMVFETHLKKISAASVDVLNKHQGAWPRPDALRWRACLGALDALPASLPPPPALTPSLVVGSRAVAARARRRRSRE